MADSDVVEKAVNVTQIVEPKFVTLTKRPANQIAFKVIREDEKGKSTMKRVRSKAKRNTASTLLAIQFSLEEDDEDIKAYMKEIGIDDYTLVADEKFKKAIRSDLTEVPADSVVIGIGNGRKAFIERAAKVEGEKSNITLAALEFEVDYFETSQDVEAWCQGHAIDFNNEALENTDIKSVVVMKRTDKDEEVRSIKIDDGVTAVIIRAEEQAIPEQFIEVISETAYGNWGWGQLDFAAALADAEFSEEGREALYMLDDVLRNILFYSPLPVQVRKELVAKTMADFAAFIGTLLDALPARVVIALRSTKEKFMADKTPKADDKSVARAEPAAVATPEPTAPAVTPEPVAASATPAVTERITREELADVVAKAVAAALEAQAKRSEPASAAAPAAPLTKVEDDPVVTALRSVNDSLKAVTDRLEKVEGTTAVRSDGGDPKQTAATPDVFAGIFGRRPS